MDGGHQRWNMQLPDTNGAVNSFKESRGIAIRELPEVAVLDTIHTTRGGQDTMFSLERQNITVVPKPKSDNCFAWEHWDDRGYRRHCVSVNHQGVIDRNLAGRPIEDRCLNKRRLARVRFMTLALQRVRGHQLVRGCEPLSR